MNGDVTAMDINCALASRYRRDGDGYWSEISVTEPNDTVLRLDGVDQPRRRDLCAQQIGVQVSQGAVQFVQRHHTLSHAAQPARERSPEELVLGAQGSRHHRGNSTHVAHGWAEPFRTPRQGGEAVMGRSGSASRAAYSSSTMWRGMPCASSSWQSHVTPRRAQVASSFFARGAATSRNR